MNESNNSAYKGSKSNEPNSFNFNKFKSDMINYKNKIQNKINKSVIISHKTEECFSEINNITPHISLNINNINEIISDKNKFPMEENKNNIKHDLSSKNNNIPDFNKLWHSFSLYLYNEGNDNNSTTRKIEEEKCMICNEELKEEEKKNNILECEHFFCDDCYYEFLKENINSNFIEKIKCPQKDCSTKLFDEFIEKKLIKDIPLLDKYKKLQKKRQLMLDPNIQLCPFPDCDSYAKRESSSKCVSCIKYNHKFCFICLKDWHGDTKCENIVDKSFEKWRDSDKVKRCPKCKFFIEKNEGCNHITCLNCKYEFCWFCLSEYNRNHFKLGRCSGLQYSEFSICSNRIINFLYQCILILLKCIAFTIACPFIIIFLIYYLFYKDFYYRYTSFGNIIFGISGVLSCLNFIICLIPITSFISILMLFYWPLQDKILSLFN